MGLFGDLFGKKEPVMGPADLSVLGADIHSHFIPGIDDGSQSLAQSIELLEAMHALGYRKVITTPHSMADGYRNPTEVILGGLEELRAEWQAGSDLSAYPWEVQSAAEHAREGLLASL